MVELNGALWVSAFDGELLIDLETGDTTQLPGKGEQAVRSGDRLFVLTSNQNSFTVEARSLADLHVEWSRTFEVLISKRITLQERVIISADGASLFVVHPWWTVYELSLDGAELNKTTMSDHGENAIGGWAGNVLIKSEKQIGACIDKVVPLAKKFQVACINESGEVAIVDSHTGKAIRRTLFEQEVVGLFRTATGVRVLTTNESEASFFEL